MCRLGLRQKDLACLLVLYHLFYLDVYTEFKLDDNDCIEEREYMGSAERWISPSHPCDGSCNLHVGGQHEDPEYSVPCSGSTFFVVCPFEENACLYSGNWEIDLWNDTSNHCEHDAISSEYDKQNDHATTNASSPDSKVRCHPSDHDNGWCHFITGFFRYLLNF